jgi:hypothetical protein
MKLPFSGGCDCRAIRYECTAGPLEMFQCHCRDCQHASGGVGAFAILMPKEFFKFTKGTPRYHFTQSEMGFQHKRGFCPECGSRLTGGENADGSSPFVGINAASLDDPSWFRPKYHIFVCDAQPWDQLNPAIPRFEKYPPPSK